MDPSRVSRFADAVEEGLGSVRVLVLMYEFNYWPDQDLLPEDFAESSQAISEVTEELTRRKRDRFRPRVHHVPEEPDPVPEDRKPRGAWRDLGYT